MFHYNSLSYNLVKDISCKSFSLLDVSTKFLISLFLTIHSPLTSSAAFFNFGANRKQNESKGKLNPESLSLSQLYIAGAGAGIGNSVISGPVEHIRIRASSSSPTFPYLFLLSTVHLPHSMIRKESTDEF